MNFRSLRGGGTTTKQSYKIKMQIASSRFLATTRVEVNRLSFWIAPVSFASRKNYFPLMICRNC